MKTLLTISAVFSAIFGLGMFLVPAQFIAAYGGDILAQGEIPWRFFGSSALGVAVVHFLARNAPPESVALRAILYGGFVGYASGLVVNVLVRLTEEAQTGNWLNIALSAIFTLAFGYVAFVRRPGAA